MSTYRSKLQMATMTIPEISTPTTEDVPVIKPGMFAWLLLIPMLFFTTHGFFSFQEQVTESVTVARATSSAAVSHDHGALGAFLPLISYGIVLWALIFNFRGVMHVVKQAKLLTFLALFSIASAAWSQNPVRSLYSGTAFLLCTLFAYYLVLRYTPEEIMSLVMRIGLTVAFLGLIMVFLFPKYGISHSDRRSIGAWLGLFVDRVSSAKFMVFALSPALIFGPGRSTRRNLLYALPLLTFIIMAKAVTALAVTGTFILIMVVVQASRKLERNTALFLGAIVGVLSITFILTGDELVAQVLALFGRDMTLTGRTEIWALLMNSIAKAPWLGYGYYAFWQGMEGESANVIRAAHWFFGYAHNGILEIVLQLGLIGTALFFGTFIIACKNAWFCFKYGRSIGAEWYLSILIYAVLYNIDEETVMWPNDLLSIFYIVACCGLAMEARRIRSEMIMQQFEPEPSLELQPLAA
jgi:exopolysaccharide production protein ExoQ